MDWRSWDCRVWFVVFIIFRAFGGRYKVRDYCLVEKVSGSGLRDESMMGMGGAEVARCICYTWQQSKRK